MPKDRGRYVSTYVAIEDDPDFRQLSHEARLLFWTLKHWPEGNAVGIFTAFPDALMARSGLNRRAINVTKTELETFRFALWDGDIVWLRNHLRFSPSINWENANHVKGLYNILDGLPKSSLLNAFADHYHSIGILSEYHPKPITITEAEAVTRTEAEACALRGTPRRRASTISGAQTPDPKDTPGNRSAIEAYNTVFGTEIGCTPGNLSAAGRAFAYGYTLEQMRRVFAAVKGQETDFATWCYGHKREFEYLVRPEYKHHKTHEMKQGPIDVILNELATGARAV